MNFADTRLKLKNQLAVRIETLLPGFSLKITIKKQKLTEILKMTLTPQLKKKHKKKEHHIHH